MNPSSRQESASPATSADPGVALAAPAVSTDAPDPAATRAECALPAEIGGREGPEPTRFGDWERRGRCIDF